MQVISLFSGCGGLDFGFKKYFEIIDICEKDIDSINTYNLNFKTNYMYNNI